MSKDFGFECEEAIALLSKVMPVGKDLSKPSLFHSVRVGTYLYEKGYSKEIVLAGFFHDILEDSDFKAEQVKEKLGDQVLAIIRANTKNSAISDASQKREELISRCVNSGKESVIVMAANLLDNFKYYERLASDSGIHHLEEMTGLLFTHVKENLEEPVMAELNNYYRKHRAIK